MTSNIKPLAILASYMATAVALTIRCIAIARDRRSQKAVARPAVVALFATLAAVSLAATWSYMFAYFRWSYLDWAARSPAAAAAAEDEQQQLRLGEWLRETSLFRQAWFSALETPARAWWTLQIFGFCAIWSVMLSVQATKRKIPHVWVFMLLGQIVAISFASNLFFLAVLAHDVPEDRKRPASNPQNAPSRSSDTAILLANLTLTILLFRNIGSPYFLYLLLAPHVLAFAPLLRDRLSAPGRQVTEPSTLLQFGVLAVLVAAGTLEAVKQGADWQAILDTLYEHPAVSSVGWDVICCWASYTAWAALRGSV